MALDLTLRDPLSEIIQHDIQVLTEQLLNVYPSDTYNIGLRTISTEPQTIEQVTVENTPWLAVIDGDGSDDFQPCSQVDDETEIIYLGYVWKDKSRFGSATAPEICRAVMRDVMKVLDDYWQRQITLNGVETTLVFGRSDRERNVIHDDRGEWSAFIITESVRYNRQL